METTANAQLATVKHAEKVSMEARDTAGQELGRLVPSILNPPAMAGWRGSGCLFPMWERSKRKAGLPGAAAYLGIRASTVFQGSAVGVGLRNGSGLPSG